MAINKDVDIDLAIEQLNLNHNMYSLDKPNKKIVRWFETNVNPQPTDEQINAAWEAWKSIHGSLAMVELRYERDKKLKESDWMAVPDRTMTDETKNLQAGVKGLTSQSNSI